MVMIGTYSKALMNRMIQTSTPSRQSLEQREHLIANPTRVHLKFPGMAPTG
jgi:hypothetical protein